MEPCTLNTALKGYCPAKPTSERVVIEAKTRCASASSVGDPHVVGGNRHSAANLGHQLCPYPHGVASLVLDKFPLWIQLFKLQHDVVSEAMVMFWSERVQE